MKWCSSIACRCFNTCSPVQQNPHHISITIGCSNKERGPSFHILADTSGSPFRRSFKTSVRPFRAANVMGPAIRSPGGISAPACNNTFTMPVNPVLPRTGAVSFPRCFVRLRRNLTPEGASPLLHDRLSTRYVARIFRFPTSN